MPRPSILRSALAALVTLAATLAAIAQPQPASPPPPSLPTLWIIGDSTARIDAPANAATPEPRVGWGTPLAAFFDPARIRVVNAAKAGRSSRTYFTEHRWDRVLDQLHPGDFVLINFGHNDGAPVAPAVGAMGSKDPGEIGTGKDRGSLPGTGDDTRTVTHPDGAVETVHSFGWYLRRYVSDTRSKGATPILLSVTPRNLWTDGKTGVPGTPGVGATGWKLEPGLGHFRPWTAQVARQTNTDYVDLTGIVVRQYEKLGPEKVAAFFPLDHTHTNLAGATLNARSVVAGLKALPDSPLNPYLSTEGQAVVRADEMSMALPANPALPTLWIIGDSTVRNGQGDGANGQWGWGDEIAPYFRPQKINVVNRALGGTSSRTYYNSHWPSVLAMMHQGDYVLMQFGHNDNGPLDDPARARGTLPGNSGDTRTIDNPITHHQETVHTYGWYLGQMIDEAREHGATPIVLSLIPRKVWEGHRIRREPYVDWARQAAQQSHAPFVNLNEIIAEQYDAMGPAAVEPLFADPHTHTSLAGARLNAKSVIEGLKGLHHDPLRKYLSPEAKPLRPFREESKGAFAGPAGAIMGSDPEVSR